MVNKVVKEKVFEKVVTWKKKFDKDILFVGYLKFSTPIFIFLTLVVCDSSKECFPSFVILSIAGVVGLLLMGAFDIFDSLPKKRSVRYVEVKK